MYNFIVSQISNVSEDNIPEDINEIEFIKPALFSYVDRVEIGRVVNDYKKYYNLKENTPNVMILTFPNSENNMNVILKLLSPSFNYEKLQNYRKVFSNNIIFSTEFDIDILKKIIPPYIIHKFDRTLWFGEFASP